MCNQHSMRYKDTRNTVPRVSGHISPRLIPCMAWSNRGNLLQCHHGILCGWCFVAAVRATLALKGDPVFHRKTFIVLFPVSLLSISKALDSIEVSTSPMTRQGMFFPEYGRRGCRQRCATRLEADTNLSPFL